MNGARKHAPPGGIHAPGGYTLGAGLVTETVMTFFFLLVIIGSTDGRAPAAGAALAGLASRWFAASARSAARRSR